MIRKRLLVTVVTMVVIALGVTTIPLVRADGPIPSDPQRPGPPSARGIQPVEYDGNPTCIDFAPEGEVWTELKVDPVEDGEHNDEFLVVTIDERSTDDGTVFDWTSNANIEAIFVKGGPRGNFYDYSAVDYVWDNDLHASINPQNDKYFGLSHISFCYIAPDPTPTPSPTPPEETPSPTPPQETPTPTPPQETPTPTPSGTPAPAPSPTPSATPPQETPSPTPPEETPSPTPPQETPSPTPPQETPSPTPPEETPSPTPPQETPSPTPPDDTPTPVSVPESTPTPTVETPTPDPAPDATPTPEPEATPTPEPALLPVTGGGSGLALWLALVGAGSILFLISPAIRRRLTTAT